MKKIVITAANGFMGRNLVRSLVDDYEVICLVRNPHILIPNAQNIFWDGESLGEWKNSIDGAFCVINLAGRSVDCRYNEANKAEIYNSRLKSTKVIGEAIELAKIKPEIWINAASATIYRHSLITPMTEAKGEYGEGFSVDVCQKWEQMFYNQSINGVRQVALRTAIVLGNDGGALRPLQNLVKVGLGGTQGNGNQMFSWIHIQDFCKAILFILNNDEVNGSINIAAPNPVPNHVLMRSLRKVYERKFGIPLSTHLLKLGARIIRTETELILKSRYVIPEKLINAGFEFEFGNLDEALTHLKLKK